MRIVMMKEMKKKDNSQMRVNKHTNKLQQYYMVKEKY